MAYVCDLCSSVSLSLPCSPSPVLPSSKSIPPSFLLPSPSFHSFCTSSSLYSGCCQASDMYVEQLKDVLKHSCPKRIAGFFTEPIQVHLTTCTQTGKVSNLCFPSLSLPSPSPCLFLPFFLPLSPSSSFSPSFPLPFFHFHFLPPSI